MDAGRLPLFGAHTWGRGHVHSLPRRDGILWCGSRFLPTNSGLKTKKKSSARNLRLRLCVHSCFSSWNETLLTFGGHKQYFGGAQALKCIPVTPGLLLSFGAQFSLEGNFSFREVQAVIWGEAAPKCSFDARPVLRFPKIAFRSEHFFGQILLK